MRSVVIVGAVRLPGAKYGGSLKKYTATDLGGLVIGEGVRRAGLSPEDVGQVIMGTGWQAGLGPNPARVATIAGNLPVTCPAFSVNMRCGSGLRAIQLGILSVGAGEEDVILAGGMESASNVPYYAEGMRWGGRMGDQKMTDGLLKDGYLCPMAEMHMGETAELLVDKYEISREEQDAYALSSQDRAVEAVNKGVFVDEILPVEVKERKGVRLFDKDELPKDDTTMETLGKLPAIFKKDGTVTAGTSSVICDSAAALTLMAEERAREVGVKPMARILSYSYVAVDPVYMGLSPIKTIPDALQKAGLELKDMDFIELNEAFAAQILACDRELHFDRSKLNAFGGAIALGHPGGATGAKLFTTLVHALKNTGKRYGLVSMCIGGGQGTTVVVENLMV